MTDEIRQNAHKFAFLVHLFPEKTIEDRKGPNFAKDPKDVIQGFITLLGMPGVLINTAIWGAIELGLVEEPDGKTGYVKFKHAPVDGWEFGPSVDNFEGALLFAFGRLALKHTDLEETYLGNWVAGINGRDVLISMRHMLEDGRLVEYHIKDGENDYKFFSLAKNAHHKWGQLQFKKNPLEKEEPAEK